MMTLTFVMTCDPALLGRHVTAVRPWMAEALVAVGTLERFLPTMDPYVLLQMMFELERLPTLRTFKLPEIRRLVMADHVTLETVNVGEGFAAYFTGLRCRGNVELGVVEVSFQMEGFVALWTEVLDWFVGVGGLEMLLKNGCAEECLITVHTLQHQVLVFQAQGGIWKY